MDQKEVNAELPKLPKEARDINIPKLNELLHADIAKVELPRNDVEGLTQLLSILAKQQNTYYMMFYAEFYRLVTYLTQNITEAMDDEQGFVWGVTKKEENILLIFNEDEACREKTFQDLVDSLATVFIAIVDNTSCLLDPAGLQHRQTENLKDMELGIRSALNVMCCEGSFLGGCDPDCGSRRTTVNRNRKSYVRCWLNIRNRVINIHQILLRALYITNIFQIVLAKCHLYRNYDDDEIAYLKRNHPELHGYVIRNMEVVLSEGVELHAATGYLPADFWYFCNCLAPLCGEKETDVLPPIMWIRERTKFCLKQQINSVHLPMIWENLLGKKYCGFMKNFGKRMRIELQQKKMGPKPFDNYLRYDTVELNQNSSIRKRAENPRIIKKTPKKKAKSQKPVNGAGLLEVTKMPKELSIRDYHSDSVTREMFMRDFDETLIRSVPFCLRFDHIMDIAMEKVGIDTDEALHVTLRSGLSPWIKESKLARILCGVEEPQKTETKYTNRETFSLILQDNLLLEEEKAKAAKKQRIEKAKSIRQSRKDQKKAEKRAKRIMATRIAQWWKSQTQKKHLDDLIKQASDEMVLRVEELRNAEKSELSAVVIAKWWRGIQQKPVNEVPEIADLVEVPETPEILEAENEKETGKEDESSATIKVSYLDIKYMGVPHTLVGKPLWCDDDVDDECTSSEEPEEVQEESEEEQEKQEVHTDNTEHAESAEIPVEVAVEENVTEPNGMVVSVEGMENIEGFGVVANADYSDTVIAIPEVEESATEPCVETPPVEVEDNAKNTTFIQPQVGGATGSAMHNGAPPRVHNHWAVIGDFNEALGDIARYLDFLFDKTHLLNGVQFVEHRLDRHGVLPFHEILRFEYMLHLLNSPKLLDTHCIITNTKRHAPSMSEQIQFICMASEMSDTTIPLVLGIARRQTYFPKKS